MPNHRRSIGGDRPHEHRPGCGHAAIAHGDHVDCLVDGRLHPRGERCDEHGPVEILKS